MDSSSFWRPFDVVGCHLFGRRFVGAQSVDGVLDLGREMKKRGYRLTYNLLGEHAVDLKVIKAALKTTLELIQKMDDTNSGNVSCKPTLYGLMISKLACRNILNQIVGAAHRHGVEVEFDAEDYSHLEDTFDIFNYFVGDPIYKNTVRQAVQAHIKNIEMLMDKYGLWDKNLRIVKGAGVYDEKDFIADKDGFVIRERYLDILRQNIKRGRVPFAATIRDGTLTLEARALAEELGGSVEIQTLYGPFGTMLRKRLLAKGYPVRIYTTFVDQWCRDAWKPYGLRRARDVRKLFFKSVFNR